MLNVVPSAYRLYTKINDIQGYKTQLEQQTDRNKSIISAILNNTAFYVATSLQQILN